MSRTHEELSAMSVISPEFKVHSQRRPVKLPPSFPDVNTARKLRRDHIDALTHAQPIPDAIPDLVEEHEVFVPATADGFKIPVTVYAPTKQSASSNAPGFPVIMLMHEGGWHLGDRKDEEMNARLFVRDLACVVLNVEYRLGPEFLFPTGAMDCYSVLRLLSQEPKMFHDFVDPQCGIVLGGSSAGGNLAAVLAHKAREDGLKPPVTGQWLSVAALAYPNVCPEKYRAEYVSMRENQSDPIIGKLKSEGSTDLKKLLGIREEDPLFTPFASSLYPPRKDHDERSPLAKAFFQVAGMDPLRDQSLIYERALREEWDVETKLVVYAGYGHMFWTNWPEMEESKKYWRDMVQGMAWLLGSDIPLEYNQVKL